MSPSRGGLICWRRDGRSAGLSGNALLQIPCERQSVKVNTMKNTCKMLPPLFFFTY